MAASGSLLLPSLLMPGEQWLWDGGSTASTPHPTGMHVLMAWEAGTNRHPLLHSRVGCSWYPAQIGSGVLHKQTPPSINPMGSAPGATQSHYKSQQLKGCSGGKNPLCISLLGPNLCHDGGGSLPPEPFPTSLLSRENSSAQPQSSREDGYKAATGSTRTEE